MKKSIFAICLLALPLAACGNDATHVAGPFYLMYFETPEQMALFRCPDGPDGDLGCAIDGLPDATVFAAGADTKYVVVARHPRIGEVTERGITQYFYFARIANERSGYGLDPEKIIGPLTGDEFTAAKRRLKLPEFSVRLSDLE